jgi:hypothetical protein
MHSLRNIPERTNPAKHWGSWEYSWEEFNQPRNILIQHTTALPVTTHIELIPEAYYRLNPSCVLPMCRERMTNADNTNVLAVIVLLTTRLSELSSPERLVQTNSSSKKFERLHNGRHMIYRNDKIVPIDTHRAGKTFHVFPGK